MLDSESCQEFSRAENFAQKIPRASTTSRRSQVSDETKIFTAETRKEQRCLRVFAPQR